MPESSARLHPRAPDAARLTPVRPHVQTGQTTPESLVYEAIYLLEIAGVLPGWNLAAWHKPHVIVIPECDGPTLPGVVAGNTLHDGDCFGRDVSRNQHPLWFARCELGNRLPITTSGAGTLTSARRSHRIPLPVEYALQGDEIRAVAPAVTVCP